jgi:hypothetical protein
VQGRDGSRETPTGGDRKSNLILLSRLVLTNNYNL